MNFVLWFLQFLIGLAFIMAGYGHGFRAEQMKTQPGGQWITALPKWLVCSIAFFEVLGGIGVILPAVTGILPGLVPLAAAGLALIMLLAMGFHLMRREVQNIVLNLVLFIVAAFVAYGRFAIYPI